MRPVGCALSLRARSASEYLHRALAEEDANSVNAPSAASPVSDSLRGEALPFAYTPGAARGGNGSASAPKATRHAALDVYLARAAKFPDVAERLVAGHLKASDITSALVTSDWYSGGEHFKGWALPSAFSAHLLAKMGRHDEARDAARVALARGPFWSLGGPLAPTAALAGYAGRSAAEVKAAVQGALQCGDAGLADCAASYSCNVFCADGGVQLEPGMRPAKTPAQVRHASFAAHILVTHHIALLTHMLILALFKQSARFGGF